MRQWLVLFALLPAMAGAAVRVLDDTGRTVELAEPARRIVSLAPHATELLYGAGAGDRLVAVAQYSDYPEAAKRLPRIGGSAGLDLERIVAYRPDLVVGWASGNPARTIERLRDLGLTVFLSEPRQVHDIATNLERIGALAGTGPAARAAADLLRREWTALADRHAGRAPLRVFFQVLDPLVITVNDKHLVSEVGRACSARNVFGPLTRLDPVVSEEAVLAADPEVIVASGTEEAWRDWEARWRSRTGLTATKRGALYFIPADLLHRPSPRILQGARRLCGYLEDARERASAAGKRAARVARDARPAH